MKDMSWAAITFKSPPALSMRDKITNNVGLLIPSHFMSFMFLMSKIGQ
jgi:hypothetical protein